MNEPLGLSLEILRLRAFAQQWRDSKRERREDEEAPTGPMAEWVDRVGRMMLERDSLGAMADLRAIRGH